MNKIEEANTVYTKSDNLLRDAQHIIEAAQSFAYKAVNIAMLQRNWLLGKRIAEEELQGKDRAEYGAEIIKKLSSELTKIYGNGFTKTNLYTFTEFYNAFPNIFHAVSGKSSENIFHTMSGKLENENFHTLCGKSEIANLDTPCLKSFTLLTCSILHGNEQLFASKYKIYMPSEEELRAEIENQKKLFYLQQNTKTINNE